MKLDVDQLLGTTKPTASQVLVGTGEPATLGNVVPFSSSSSTLRPQDIILNMLKDGCSIADMVTATGLDEFQVSGLASSPWMERELAAHISTQPEQTTTTIKAVMRNQAFKAVTVVGKLLDDPLSSIRLAAAKVALEYTLTKAGESSLQKPKAAVPQSEEELRKEHAELSKQIESAHARKVI